MQGNFFYNMRLSVRFQLPKCLPWPTSTKLIVNLLTDCGWLSIRTLEKVNKFHERKNSLSETFLTSFYKVAYYLIENTD